MLKLKMQLGPKYGHVLAYGIFFPLVVVYGYSLQPLMLMYLGPPAVISVLSEVGS